MLQFTKYSVPLVLQNISHNSQIASKHYLDLLLLLLSDQESELPNWSSACKVDLLIQPSSAALEYFSLYMSVFVINGVIVYTEASVILQ